MQNIINFIWNNYLDIFAFHIISAIILFFLMNWFGKRSKGFGYTEITIFIQDEDNPAFNFLYRVLFPSVFIVLISTCFKIFEFERYIYNIFLVTLYSFSFRILYNFLSGRTLLVDWRKVLLYSISSIFLSYFVNIKIINKTNFLPNFETMTNEIWILIFIFIYQILNKTKLFKDTEEQRKFRFIIKRYFDYTQKYGDIINSIVSSEKLKIIIYSIIIHESFNRYKIGRILIENNLFKIGKAKTLGLMQVKTEHIITDEQSIKIGVNKIFQNYKEIINKCRINGEILNEYSFSRNLILNYNKDSNYVDAINHIMNIIEVKIYKTNVDDLIPTDILYGISGDVKRNVKRDEKKV
jgi:hypothetical protein